MHLLRKHLGFRRLWGSQLVSLMGDWLSFVAISLLALQTGDSVVALALVLVAHSLPQALMAPVAGVLCDRFDRIKLMMGSNLLQAGLTIGMTVAAALGSLVAIQILLVLRASAAAIIMPAENAALPHLVDRDELYRANSIVAATWSVAFALGMALGGVLALLGPVLALTIDAMTFLVAAGLLRGLPRVGPPRSNANEGIASALTSVSRDMREAATHTWRDRPLLGAVLAKTPLALAGGGAWVLLNLVAADPRFIGAGGIALGLLHATRGIGTGVGPLWASRYLERGFSPIHARTLAAWLVFAAITLFTLVQAWPVALLAVFLWGVGTGTNWVTSTAAIQHAAPDRILGRVSAIDTLLFTSAMAMSALASAFVVDLTGDPNAAGWLGLALGIGSWCVAARLSRTSVVEQAAGMPVVDVTDEPIVDAVADQLA